MGTKQVIIPDGQVDKMIAPVADNMRYVEAGALTFGVEFREMNARIITETYGANPEAMKFFESLPGGSRVAAAMRARPDLVGGPDGADYLLMRDAPGWLAKGGAEGLLCAAGPEGIGVALKTEDGASRAHPPALAAFLGLLGVELPGLVSRPVVNTRGERVGEIVTRGGGSA